MTRTVQIAVIAHFIGLVFLVQAPVEAKAQRRGEEGAIRRVMQRFEASWNKHDVDSFMELFAQMPNSRTHEESSEVDAMRSRTITLGLLALRPEC